MPNRVKREYVALSPQVIQNEERLAELIDASFEYVASLPEKKTKG
jgi:hypothetical protein